MPAPRPSGERAGGLARAGLWLLPVLLWAIATLWLGGDLGKLADDWSQHVRDPATGAYEWPPFRLPGSFWRPLHLVLVESLQTLLWDHDRINHTVSALWHGVCALLLWRVLRSAGCTACSACAAAMIFVVYPAPWEVVFWPAALSTGVATCLLLVMAWLVCRASRSGGWGAYALLPAVGFGLCCFNEQPGAVTPALALLSLAVAPSPRLTRRAVVRACALCSAAMLGCASYAALYLRSAPEGARGSAGSLVPLDQMGGRLGSLLPLIAERMTLAGFAPGAVRLGVDRLGEHGSLALIGCAIALGVAAWCWWRRWMRDPDEPSGGGVSRPWLLVAFGLAGAALAWAPLVLIARYAAPSRGAYVPAVCLAFVLAPLLDAGAARPARRAPARRGPFRRVTRGATCLLIIGAALLGAVMLVGVQGLLRARSRLDLAQAMSLRLALPDPPPGAVFLPLSMRDRPVQTGSPRFDQGAIGAFRLDWSAPPLVRSVFARADIAAGACWHQRSREVVLVDERGVVLRRRLGDAAPIGEGRFRLGWDRVVPFEIDESGTVRPITRLLASRPDGEPLVIEPPLTVAAAAAGRCPSHEYRFRAWEAP